MFKKKGKSDKSRSGGATRAGGTRAMSMTMRDDDSTSSSIQSSTMSYASSGISPLRQLLDAVNMSILPDDLRLSSIQQACQFFDHTDRSMHDVELREGAAFILYQKLAFCLSLEPKRHIIAYSPPVMMGNPTTTNTTTNRSHEIMLLTNALEMVHRASPDTIAATWHDIGLDILPILVKVMERPYKEQHLYPVTTTNATRDTKLSIQKITKLLALYSLVPEAKYHITHCPGMLYVLVKVLDTRWLHHADQTSSTTTHLVMTEAARFHTLATLTNLAASENNRRTLLQTPGLVDAIARVVPQERSDVARQCSALALMNLSHGDATIVPEMTSELLLETLISLLQDKLPETRRNAAVALVNVASVHENSIQIATFHNGMMLQALLELLFVPDAAQAGHAAETLFNMACTDESTDTTIKMAQHPHLLSTLAEALQNANVQLDVKMYCAATLRRMAECSTDHYNPASLWTALVEASSWNRTADIGHAWQAQASQPRHRVEMAEHTGVLETLSQLCQAPSSPELQMTAVRALEQLSQDESARQVLAHHEGCMLALTQANFDGKEGANADREQTEVEALAQVALKNLVNAL